MRDDASKNIAFRLSLSLAALLLMSLSAPGGLIHAQSCNPAVVSYLVRDEQGKLLNAASLTVVYKQLPESIGDAKTDIGEVSFVEDGRTYYWPEDIDWPKGKKQSALQFINSGVCAMHLQEVTLTYHNKAMRLIFNFEITRTQNDRRPVVDALPFQEGAFALDLKSWSPSPEQMIPAARWKRVTDSQMSEKYVKRKIRKSPPVHRKL